MSLYKNKKHFLFTIVVSTAIILLFWKNVFKRDTQKMGSEDRFAKILSLFNSDAIHCEDLSQNWRKWNFSKTYHEKLTQFETKRQESYEGQTDGEGHSGQVPEEYQVLHMLAGVNGPVTVCETGFNFGHSAFNFLTANNDLRVFSFDLGNHLYAKKMAVNLAEMFGAQRIHVEFGDSQTSIPLLKSTGQLPFCDIIFVDGGHTFQVADADITNLATHASKDNVIIMDDHPTDWSHDFGKAWENHLQQKTTRETIQKETPQTECKEGEDFVISEKIRCVRRQKVDKLSRGFVVGRVVGNECKRM